MNFLLFFGFVLLTGTAGVLGIAIISGFSDVRAPLLAWSLSALLAILGYSNNHFSLRLPARSFLAVFIGGFLFRFILAGVAVVLLYPLVEHSVWTFVFCFAGYYFLYQTVEVVLMVRMQREKKKNKII